MSYEEFKEQLLSYLQEHIGEYLPPQYADGTIVPYSKSEYNGGTVDGFGLQVEGQQTFPVLYMGNMYDRFLNDPDFNNHGSMTEQDLRMLTEGIADLFVEKMENSFVKKYAKANSFAEMYKPENLFMVVLNTEANQDILSECPHREMLDLSITYKLLISDESENQIVSARVTDIVAAQMGMTEEQIFQTAYENTRRLFPPTVNSMAEVLSDMMDEEIEDPYIGGAETMLIATNDRKINGACVMLYPEVLDEMAERLGSDIYICPSSVHEILAVPRMGQTGAEMEEIVREVNATQVSVNERLSNHAYYYDAKEKRISFATSDIAPSINPAVSMRVAVAEDKTYSLESGYLPVSEGVSQKQGIGKPKEAAMSSVRQRRPKF